MAATVALLSRAQQPLVLLGRAVASAVMEALGVSPQRPSETLTLGDTALLQMNMREAAAYFNVARDVIAQRTRQPVVDTQSMSLW